MDDVKTIKFSIAEEIPVPEYSRLDLSYNDSCCWIVSDKNCKVDFIGGWGNS